MMPTALRQITRDEAALARTLAATRDITAPGMPPIRTTQPPSTVAGAVHLGLAFACGQARLAVPVALVQDLLATLDPAASDAPSPWRDLLLELALDDALSALELQHPELSAALAAPQADTPLPHALGLHIAGHTLRLDMAFQVAQAVAAALEAMPPRRCPLPDLPVPLHPRLMAATVTLAELRRAQTGDVIPARGAPDSGIVLVAAERLIWHARRDAARLHVTSGPRRPGPAELEEWWMQDEPLMPEEEGTLGDLPVRLSFELGRLELSLAELETLGPGHVFELGRAEEAAVDILANGRRIGAGRVVLVAGQPGVQITRLASR